LFLPIPCVRCWSKNSVHSKQISHNMQVTLRESIRPKMDGRLASSNPSRTRFVEIVLALACLRTEASTRACLQTKVMMFEGYCEWMPLTKISHERFNPYGWKGRIAILRSVRFKQRISKLRCPTSVVKPQPLKRVKVGGGV